MLDIIYISLLWGLVGTTFMFSLFFFVLSVPPIPALRKYKTARLITACVYLCLGASNLTEVIFHDDTIDIQLNTMILLFVSMFQAMLLTYAHLTLINLRFVTKKKIFFESLPFILCIIAGIANLNLDIERRYTDYLNIFFILYYISLLFRFTIYFQRIYNDYHKRMDNYFAEQEIKRFRWIFFSFYASLGVGIIALISVCFDTLLSKTLFNLIVLLFYSYFGVHFLNYAYQFQAHAGAIAEESESTEKQEETKVQPRDHSRLETNIKEWYSQKKFLSQGLTIESVATQLNTNRAYLSEYVNSCMNITFKEWITSLRIQEAKGLLQEQIDLSVSDIAEQAGFSDKSNFSKMFTKQTGVSPKLWREQNTLVKTNTPD